MRDIRALLAVGIAASALAATATSLPARASVTHPGPIGSPSPGGKTPAYMKSPPPAPPEAAASPTYYEYSSGYSSGSPAGATSGSVTMSVQHEGTRDPGGGTDYLGDHSLGDFVIWGTGSESPIIEMELITGTQYCHAWTTPCFQVSTWKNGTIYFSQGYVEAPAPNGLPNDGSWHPTLGGDYTIGYEFSYGRVNITLGGTIVGWIPQTFWGSTTGFGSVKTEQVASEVYNLTGNWTGSPLPSMDYTFSNFTDSLGNTLAYYGVSTPYTVSGITNEGWTVSGGQSPDDAGTYWPVEASQDNGYCLDNTGNVASSGNKVQIWKCLGDAAQQWRFNPATHALVNQNGYCLDDPHDTNANGTQLQIWACLGDQAQTWDEVQAADDFTEYENLSTGVCLDNPADSTTNGTKAQIWSCLGDAAQHWDAPNF
jgi:hypothetical protein